MSRSKPDPAVPLAILSIFLVYYVIEKIKVNKEYLLDMLYTIGITISIIGIIAVIIIVIYLLIQYTKNAIKHPAADEYIAWENYKKSGDT
jgi:hypothetical protein